MSKDKNQEPTSADSEYDVDQMRYMSDLEHVRERSGMYIGNKNVRGLHHLVQEVVDNSIDEAMAGQATRVTVTINNDGSIMIGDDGRGIPVAEDPNIGKSALEGVMTMLKYGGKFGKQAYKTSGGLHGIGVKAVNFLSEWCEVEVHRDGHVWQQEYERGKPTGPVVRIGATTTTGTKTTFKPDPQAFGDLKFDYNILHKRLHELSFLNPGCEIVYRDERIGQGDTFHHERGIVEYVEYLNRASDAVHKDVVYIRGEIEIGEEDAETGGRDSVEVEIAFQYANEYTENVHCFVNNINTVDGGTHLTGFRTALTRVFNAYGKKANLFKDITPNGEDFREGITAVISIRHPDPQFESQTKVKLNNTDVEGAVSGVVSDYLSRFLEENPKIAKVLVNKGITAAEARDAARKAKKALRDRKGVLGGGSLPGKLRDCISKEMEKCELYLVEGDSAGGSAEGGRLKEYQAILPLRGKIINAYKSRESKVLENLEVQSIISAVASGIGDDQDVNKRRYGKVIIMTDADVDGSHIRTLLLCFFYRQMYELVSGGHVYVAQPPLFRVRNRKETYYVQSEDEMKEQLLERGLADAVFDPRNGVEIQGDDMAKLCRALASTEEALVALERRGISLKVHAERINFESGKLPVYHVFLGKEEHWFASRKELDEFLKDKEESTGEEFSVSEAPSSNGDEATAPKLHITELHEVRTINAGLKEISELGFDIQALIPQERTGVEESRYVLRRGENEIPLEDLRGLLAAVRRAGEKGLTLTRFKGLGEMNAEELRETTLDPDNRTLFQVTMKDAGAADEMFRVLMGDKVEPRRDFIEKHALEVRNLDV